MTKFNESLAGALALPATEPEPMEITQHHLCWNCSRYGRTVGISVTEIKLSH